MKRIGLLLLCVAPLAIWSPLASADKDKVEDQVNFQVEAGRDVDNDSRKPGSRQAGRAD